MIWRRKGNCKAKLPVGRAAKATKLLNSSDELIIEAHVTQLDRKVVHSGLQAHIHLSAYSSRVVPKIPGTVRTVSADRLVDDTTHQPYYLARVAVDRQTLKRLAPTGVSGGHFLRSEDDPHGSQEPRRHTHRTTLEGIPSASRDDSARACRRSLRNARPNQPL